MPPISAAPAMKWSQSGEQLGHQVDVAGVALDEPVARVVVVGLRDLAVLGVVVDADDLVAAPQQLLDDVAADEAGRAADQDLHRASAPARVSSGDCRCSSCGRAVAVESRAEGEAVPVEVAWAATAAILKFDDAGLPVEPDRRDLGDRQPQPARLGDQLDADLEAVVGLDADLLARTRGRRP